MVGGSSIPDPLQTRGGPIAIAYPAAPKIDHNRLYSYRNLQVPTYDAHPKILFKEKI